MIVNQLVTLLMAVAAGGLLLISIGYFMFLVAVENYGVRAEVSLRSIFFWFFYFGSGMFILMGLLSLVYSPGFVIGFLKDEDEVG